MTTNNNSDPRDYILDLASLAPNPTVPPSQSGNRQSEIGNPPTPFLSIHFKCCHVYSRIYKNAAGTAYAGHCPKCRRPTSIPIAPGGSTSRFFQAE